MPRTLSKKPGYDLSRLRRFANQHLGVKWMGDMDETHLFRDDRLDVLDRYYEGTQYDDLTDWEDAVASEDYVQIRKRKPRINYNLSKAIVNKVASKLIGSSTFPSFVVEDDDDDTAFFRTVVKASKLKSALMEPVKRALASGASFARYFLVDGQIQIECHLAKYCYPVFDEAKQLVSVSIQYVYEDWTQMKPNGDPLKRWYKMTLDQQSDTIFDNPEYRPGVKPTFVEVSKETHGLGWVQGVWFVTHKDKHSPDGYSLYGDILGFIDEFNYSLSQTSQATGYNQEPQLAFNKMDEDEIDRLVRSSQKAWNLGREGEGKYIETEMAGVEKACEVRDKMRVWCLDIARIVLHDPEKLTAQAMSGEALKQLYAPLIELVDELRTMFEPMMIELIIKIGMTALKYNAEGFETAIVAPTGYVPESIDITVNWPPIFPATLQDILVAAQAAQSLSQGQIISRESLTRWIAGMIPSVDNVEEELNKIETQEPLPSPFGDFGDGGGGGGPAG